MKFPWPIKATLRFYDLLLQIIIPLLRFHHLLKDGFSQRTLNIVPPEADIWIQAASVGEAYLAVELMKNLQSDRPLKVLLSTNTKMGLDTLEAITADLPPNKNISSISKIYSPFDRPTLMKRALKAVRPRVVVLLESDLWPGLLASCKETGTKIALVNGRIREKSMKYYLAWQGLWGFLHPDITMAMSNEDAGRFAKLFGQENVVRMTNIKFDRCNLSGHSLKDRNPLASLIPDGSKFVILGSIRKEEEKEIAQTIKDIYNKNKNIIIGLFPRLASRVKIWQETLDELQLKWELRSSLKNSVTGGTIILWDTFGELPFAYGLAKTAFIGGSLAPFGGQNFLEPLTCGVIPLTGPDWSDFRWVGKDILEEGLLIEVKNQYELTQKILEQLMKPNDQVRILKAAGEYIKKHQGGTRQACRKIYELMNN